MTASGAALTVHGRRSTYVGGCRCDECRRANADYQWALGRRRRRALAADPSIVEHGTPSTYTNWGCRCDECRAANRAWLTSWQARQTGPPEHGTTNAYSNYRCRCDECRTAMAADRRERRTGLR